MLPIKHCKDVPCCPWIEKFAYLGISFSVDFGLFHMRLHTK